MAMAHAFSMPQKPPSESLQNPKQVPSLCPESLQVFMRKGLS